MLQCATLLDSLTGSLWELEEVFGGELGKMWDVGRHQMGDSCHFYLHTGGCHSTSFELTNRVIDDTVWP